MEKYILWAIISVLVGTTAWNTIKIYKLSK
jgi:hypothetical protein